MTVQELYRLGCAKLEPASQEDAAFECACLLDKLLGISKTDRLTEPNRELDESAVQTVLAAIQRRLQHEPIQYILGEWSFYGASFSVGPGVLIPRPETEELIDLVQADLKSQPAKTVLDLCAGSGCIGLTLARLHPQLHVYLLEKYPDALAYVKQNAQAQNLSNITIVEGDALLSPPTAIPPIDLLVSNPPYIPADVCKTLQAEVQKEPLTALDGGEDGLLFYRAILSLWLSKMQPGGRLYFECGDGQGADICRLFAEDTEEQTIKYDFNHIDRFVKIKL